VRIVEYPPFPKKKPLYSFSDMGGTWAIRTSKLQHTVLLYQFEEGALVGKKGFPN